MKNEENHDITNLTFDEQIKYCKNFSIMEMEDILIESSLSSKFFKYFKNKLDWKDVILYQTLSEEFIEEYIKYIDIEYLIINKKLSEGFIDKYIESFNDEVFKKVFLYQDFSIEFIEKYIEKIDNKLLWELMLGNKNIDEKFILKYKNKLVENKFDIDKIMINVTNLSEEFMELMIEEYNELDFYFLLRNQDLSMEFINKYQDKIINEDMWDTLEENQVLSEEFIDNNQDKLNWTNLSVWQKLSEEFIEKHIDLINWEEISINQKLSEGFIKKHYKNLDIGLIILYQDIDEKLINKYIKDSNKNIIGSLIGNKILTEEFMEKHKDDLDWYQVSITQNLSEEFIIKYMEYFSYKTISIYQKLSEEFIEKYIDELDIDLLSLNQDLSERFIEKNISKINFKKYSLNKYLNLKYFDRLDKKMLLDNILDMEFDDKKNTELYEKLILWDEYYFTLIPEQNRKLSLMKDVENENLFNNLIKNNLIENDDLKVIKELNKYLNKKLIGKKEREFFLNKSNKVIKKKVLQYISNFELLKRKLKKEKESNNFNDMIF